MIEQTSATRDERLLDAPLTLARRTGVFALAGAGCAALFWLLLSYPALLFVAPLAYLGGARIVRRRRGH